MLYFLPPHPQPSFLSIPTFTASLISSLPSLPPSLSLIPLSFFPSYSGSLHSFSLLTFTLYPIPFPNLTPYSTFFPTTSLASPLHPLLCPSLPSTASLLTSLPLLPHPSLPTLTPSPLLPIPLLPSSLLPSIPLLHSLLTLMPPCLPNPKPSLSFFPTSISLHFPLILLPFYPLFFHYCHD